jgi:hypothetical protein
MRIEVGENAVSREFAELRSAHSPLSRHFGTRSLLRRD